MLVSSKETFGEDKETLNRVVEHIRTKFKNNKNESNSDEIEKVGNCIKFRRVFNLNSHSFLNSI